LCSPCSSCPLKLSCSSSAVNRHCSTTELPAATVCHAAHAVQQSAVLCSVIRVAVANATESSPDLTECLPVAAQDVVLYGSIAHCSVVAVAIATHRANLVVPAQGCSSSSSSSSNVLSVYCAYMQAAHFKTSKEHH
jgi:hypothetical protein